MNGREQAADRIKRDDAVDAFAEAIKRRLDDKAAEGYTGWDGLYSSTRLMLELGKDSLDLLEGGGIPRRAIDIAARAMMLWYRWTRPERKGTQHE